MKSQTHYRKRDRLQQSQIQLSRVQLVWLMTALLAVCIPIWFFLPIWVASGALIAIGWRAQLVLKGRSEPKPWIMAVLAISLGVGVLLQYGWPPLGVEPMSAILTVAAALKFLEMSRRLDSQKLIYLCLFVGAIQPIFSQNVFSFLLALVCFTLTLTAQSMLLRDTNQQFSLFKFSFEPLRQILRLAMVSIPLTLVIFVLAPRLPAFSVIPVQMDQSTTGISDFMDPGSISGLSNSNEVAFRVDFQDEIPAPRELYWRGLVFSEFDGRSWQPEDERRGMRDGSAIIWNGRRPGFDWRNETQVFGEPIEYTVFLEPTHEDWLFALPAATSDRNTIGQARNSLLVNRIPVAQPFKYDVVTHLDYRHQATLLTPTQVRDNLAYEPGANPQTEALVASWVADLVAENGEENGEENAEGNEERNREEIDGRESAIASRAVTVGVVQSILRLFNNEFTYTLEPPLYPGNAVDQFLFDGQSGFCEHFASAAAAMLRMAGIPSRVVAGYQGGEIHPSEGYLIVHQFNAHAWVEYWQEDIGWTRLDPTAAVAPERIELGFEEFFGLNDVLDESLFVFGDMPLTNWLRLQLDNLNYKWLSLVLGYDTGAQLNLLGGFMGEVTPAKLASYLAGGLGSIFLLYFLIRAYAIHIGTTAEQRLIKLYLRQLNRLGIEVTQGMTLRTILTQSLLKRPQYRDKLVSLTLSLESLLYRQEESVNQSELKKEILELKGI